jgi:hypothetical protein
LEKSESALKGKSNKVKPAIAAIAIVKIKVTGFLPPTLLTSLEPNLKLLTISV